MKQIEELHLHKKSDIFVETTNSVECFRKVGTSLLSPDHGDEDEL